MALATAPDMHPARAGHAPILVAAMGLANALVLGLMIASTSRGHRHAERNAPPPHAAAYDDDAGAAARSR